MAVGTMHDPGRWRPLPRSVALKSKALSPLHPRKSLRAFHVDGPTYRLASGEDLEIYCFNEALVCRPQRRLGHAGCTAEISRLTAIRRRMFECSLEIGTGRPLNSFGKLPRVHVTFGSKQAGNSQDSRDGGIVDLLDVPKRTRAA